MKTLYFSGFVSIKPMPEHELKLLQKIRQDCREVAFDWPSNNTERSGPPERTLYWDEAAIRDAPWQRAKLLKMLDGRDETIAQLRTALEDLLTAVSSQEGEPPVLSAALSNAKNALSTAPSGAASDHAELLKRLPGVEAAFVQGVLCLPAHELQRRVLIQKDWLTAYACALNGIGLITGVDSARLPKDIRRAFEVLLERLRAVGAPSPAPSIGDPS